LKNRYEFLGGLLTAIEGLSNNKKSEMCMNNAINISTAGEVLLLVDALH